MRPNLSVQHGIGLSAHASQQDRAFISGYPDRLAVVVVLHLLSLPPYPHGSPHSRSSTLGHTLLTRQCV